MTIKELYETLLEPHANSWFITLKKRENNIIKVIRYYIWEANIKDYFNEEIEEFYFYPDDDEICFEIIIKNS